MKTRLATALSVAGVLSAGSAAALVNTQILDGGPVESSSSAAILPTTPTAAATATVDVAIPDVVIDTTAVPTSTTTAIVFDTSTDAARPAAGLPESIDEQSPATTQPAAPSMLTAFNVGDAGVVTVDVIGGRVVLIDARPKAGWSVTEAVELPAEHHVQVEFRSSTVSVMFQASLVDHQIVPSVSSKSIGGTTNAATSGQTATSPGAYEDDDHDEYESEHESEYESEHESEYESEYESEHDGERDDD